MCAFIQKICRVGNNFNSGAKTVISIAGPDTASEEN